MKQIATKGNRPVTRRYGAALLNSQNAAQEPTTKIAKVVEVRAEEAKLEVVKAEDEGKHVGDWGAKQRHTVTSSQPHETVGSAAAMQPHQRFGASKATSASN